MVNKQLLSFKKLPFIIVEENVVVGMNSSFVNLTDYGEIELIGKEIFDVMKVLRISPHFDYDNPCEKTEYFIFTKTLAFRNVKIVLRKLTNNKVKYLFYEKSNSRFDNKFNAVNKLILDNKIGVGIYSSPDLTLLKSNQVYLNILDEPFNNADVTIGMRMEEFVSWWKGSRGDKVWTDVINTGNTFYGKEIIGQTGNWKDRYCDNTVLPVTENGKVKYIISIVEDVTEKVLARKKIEEQARIIEQQKKRLEEIIDNISEELYIVDKNGEYVSYNKSAQRVFEGCKVKQIKDFYNEFTFYDYEGNVIQIEDMPITKLLNGQEVREYIMFTNLPTERYVSINAKPVFDSNGDFDIGVMTSKDVTHHVLYHNAFKRQAGLLHQIIDNLDLPIMRVSYPELKIIDLNQKAFNFAKVSYPEAAISIDNLKSKNILDLSPYFYDTDIYEYLNRAVKEKKVQYLRNKKFIVRSEEIYSNIFFEPIFSFNGEVIEIIMVAVDITSEVKANVKMEKALRLQEEFFANISHELKTPLNVIYSTVQLFNMYFNSGSLDAKRDSIQRYLGSITQNCYRLSKLINNVVDISKIDAGFYELNIANENIISVIEEIVTSIKEYGNSKGLNIVFDTDVEEKIIAFDSEKMERVILNLVSNAIKFSNAGSEIYVSISDKSSFIEISVKDEGVGIDKSYLDKIFDRYKQADKSLSRNAEGTGIGLNLVKSIVELHGGKITVESEFGKGSKFTVILPVKVACNTGNILAESMIKSHADIINVELSDIYF